MRFRAVLSISTLLLTLSSLPARALVHYEEGRLEVLGVQLLQDADNASVYYYIPQSPYVSTKDDGTLELLCLKFVDAQGGASGGLLHALVKFDLPPAAVAALEKELEKDHPGATIAGPVPLMQAVGEEGSDSMGSFEVVSAILSDQDEGGFTRKVLTSGAAPVTPGSKAVVAAILNPQGATLMWDSLSGPTSDLSVAIHAYYEARVKAYNAKVTAEMETIYNHRSVVSNVQSGYTKRQLRRIVDQLVQDGALKVEVFDRSKSLGIEAKELDAILSIVTDKLTELMFDSTTGWAKEPEREAGVEANQLPGRQERGWFSKVFGGARNEKYITDNQYVRKRREDIRQHKFELILDKETTIRVPLDTAGNIGGLYDELSNDPRYFRIVDLYDPAFETRTVHFQIDGNYLDAFQNHVNFVSVNFRKQRSGHPDVTHSLHFNYDDIKAGKTLQSVVFPRLGNQAADWIDFEYQVRWSTRDRRTVAIPAREDRWIAASDPAVSLVPPFEKRVVEIDADRQAFQDNDIRSAVVEFATVFLGQPQAAKRVILRPGDSEPTRQVTLFHDRASPIGQRVSWYAGWGQQRGHVAELNNDYLYLLPPQKPPAEDETADNGPTHNGSSPAGPTHDGSTHNGSASRDPAADSNNTGTGE